MSSLIDMSDLPVVKSEITTRYGETFNGEADVWRLNNGGQKFTAKFNLINDNYLRYNLKLFISFHVQRSSLSHAMNYYYSLMKQFKDYSLGEISEDSLKKHIRNEIKNKRGTKKEYALWHLIDWYCWCSDFGLPYFDEDFAFSMDNISLSGNLKGEAVRSLDKNKGPLSDNQLNSLIKALSFDTSEKYREENISTWLSLVLGTNPMNLALLKWGDFEIIESDQGGHRIYFLNVPRIKKRFEKMREEFKKRELDRRVGELLLKYKNDSNENSLIFNKTSRSLGRLITEYCENTLGLDFRVNPRRLRYTFATRLVLSGASKEKLADLLDHTDLQHVQVYYDLRHKIKGFIDAAESKRLGEIFKQFEGNILSGKDIEKVPHDLKFSYSGKEDKPVIGNCGSGELCELNPPFSCFLCPKFNAFDSSLPIYKKILKYLIGWSSKRLEDFGENDRIHTLMKDFQLAISDLINRIEEGDANE